MVVLLSGTTRKFVAVMLAEARNISGIGAVSDSEDFSGLNFCLEGITGVGHPAGEHQMLSYLTA
jgi:hypothetical protein